MLATHRAITESLKQADMGMDIAWPNIAYMPIEKDGVKQPFLEFIIGISNTVPLTLGGGGGIDKVTGIFRINVRFGMDSGAVNADDVVAKLLAYYRTGRKFAYEGATVTIIGNSVEPGAPDFGWYKVSVTIKYDSYQGRT